MATRTSSNQLGSNPLPPPPAPPTPEELAELRRKGLIGSGEATEIMMRTEGPARNPERPTGTTIEVDGPLRTPNNDPTIEVDGPLRIPREPIDPTVETRYPTAFELGSDTSGGWRPSKQLEEIYTRRLEADGLSRSDAQSAMEAILLTKKPTPPERVKEIATETFRQLGGGRLRMITGAKDIYSQDLGDGDAALTFALPAGKGNRYDVTVPYNSKDDTYGLTITKRNRVVYDNEKGFDIGQVMDTIERETKVYLTLGRRG